MKITIENSYDYNGALIQEISVDNKYGEVICPLYEYPEDATLERDMINADRIAFYMELAYNAGKNNEEFEVVQRVSD